MTVTVDNLVTKRASDDRSLGRKQKSKNPRHCMSQARLLALPTVMAILSYVMAVRMRRGSGGGEAMVGGTVNTMSAKRLQICDG